MELGTMITAKFATLNKNETLDQYKEECSKEQIQTETRIYGNIEEVDTWKAWEVEDCKVEQYFKVTPKEWEQLTNDFFANSILWREKGGTIYTGNNPDFDIDKLGQDPEMLKDYKLNNARLVTVIENDTTGETIAIDPQGYKYARYVGIEVEKKK